MKPQPKNMWIRENDLVLVDDAECGYYLARVLHVCMVREFHWITNIILSNHEDIFPHQVVVNVTRRYTKCNATLRIQRYYRKYIERKKARAAALEHTVCMLQARCKAWSVSPNNPNHMQRMKAMANGHGMKI